MGGEEHPLARTWTIVVAVVFAAVLVAMAATSCGDDNGESANKSATATGGSAEKANAQLCTDLDDLQKAVVNFQAINKTNTVDELKAARDDVRQAFDDVKSSAASVREARMDDLNTAYDGLDKAVKTVQGDQTLADIQADLQDAAVDVLLAHAQLRDQLNCPGEATAPEGTATTPPRTTTP